MKALLRTLDIILHALRATASISVRTLARSFVKKVTVPWVDWALRDWSLALLSKVQARIHVEGLEHCRDDAVYVIVSNHQSLYDIPVLFTVFHRSLRMVAKKELFAVPLWGAAMRVAGFVCVDRSRSDVAREALTLAADNMKKMGISVWIAPEGTRSKTGEVAPFKRGAFHLAKAAGVKILPVTIRGTRDILPAKTFRFQLGVLVWVEIHSPLDPGVYEGKELKAFAEDVRTLIASRLSS